MPEHDVEQIWQEFWLPILRADAEAQYPLNDEDFCVRTREGVRISLDQIKRELADYRRWMSAWRDVAWEFSGGQLSKVNYTPDVYLNAFQEEFDRQLAEAVAEALEDEAPGIRLPVGD